jgi:hypothetical protein
MAFAFDKDRATEIFFRAFKDYVNNIIRDLLNDISKPEAIGAIHTITQQLNGDYSRLVFVNESIQARIWEDEAWAASASVDIYELLAATIDPHFTISSLSMKGAYLASNELMRMCQARFQGMVGSPERNRGFLVFLGQLCTTGIITSTTPGIVLHILDSMISSTLLTANDNFDLVMSFIMLAGPYLDDQKQLREYFRTRLQHLQQRGQSFKVSWWLAIQGSVQLRERGWSVEAVQDGTVLSDQLSSDGASGR